MKTRRQAAIPPNESFPRGPSLSALPATTAAMTNESHLSGYKPPPPRTELIPGELLFQFVVDGVGWRCELRDFGNHGTEAQLFEGDEFRIGRRWLLREQ